MKFLEKDLEDIIWETNNDILNEKGLPIYGKKKRQVRIGNYGVADILEVVRPHMCFYNGRKWFEKGSINVIELKKDKIGISAFLQGMKYVKGISRYLSERGYCNSYDINLTLIGRELDKSGSFIYLSDFINSDDFNLSYYTYYYDVNGIQFEEEGGYKLKDEGFFREEVQNG